MGIEGQRVKECLMKAQIVKPADIGTLSVGSDQWESVRRGIGLTELEGVYLLNRLKVIASWKRVNEPISVADCNRMQLLYVLIEYILPNAKNIKDKDKLLHWLMSMDDLDGIGFLKLGKLGFVKLAEKKGGLVKWTAGKLYGNIKEFDFDQIQKNAV